jgi:hypothetical protein
MLFIFCCVFISCWSPKYEFVINYSKTVEDYTLISSELIKMSEQDTSKAWKKFKKSKNYKKYAPESDSVWIESYLIKK